MVFAEKYLNNVILLSDSYKLSHFVQYPKNTTSVFSYLESRGGPFKHSVFFGLQYLVKKYLEGSVVTEDKIVQARRFANAHFAGASGTFNEEGWRYILEKHQGRLPIRIKAIPEGTVVPVSNALITVENTDPNTYWLTNYIETLLVQVWYPITVATQSWHMKRKILQYLEDTGDPSLIDFKLHDFGFRGVSSVETAGLGAAAHLLSFKGTDTIPGILLAEEFYKAEEMPGFSIPASEHSTITSWGKENEYKAFANMLKQYPSGPVACVSDSFNIYDACEKGWGEKLHQKVLARDGFLVVRPDSGDPHVVLPKVLEILGKQFGYNTNEKGFKVLNPKVRLIQGDGIDYKSLEGIMKTVREAGWSIDNIAFGSGGGLLQKLDRDTMKFAFKCSHAVVDGKGIDVFKSPVTDSVKKSKMGRLKVVGQAPNLTTVEESTNEENQLVEVFENGTLVKEYNWNEVRNNLETSGKSLMGVEV